MRTYRFEITPQTWVRTTQNDSIFFRIPEEDLKKAGLQRKKRIERYNDYKDTLLGLAKAQQFILPEEGASITFFMPMSKRTPKYRRREMNLRGHRIRPDLSNLLKAVEDAMMKEDKGIWNYRSISKVWVDQTQGWIEIQIP